VARFQANLSIVMLFEGFRFHGYFHLQYIFLTESTG